MPSQNKKQKVERLNIAFTNDVTKESIWSRTFSRIGMLTLAISSAVIVIAVIFSLIAFTPIRTFIPGYPDARSKRTAIQNAIKIDSLENIISRWELYTENLKLVMEGAQPVSIDSIIVRAQTREYDEAALSMADSLLRARVEEAEHFSVSEKPSRNTTLENMHFFVPAKGAVVRKYDKVLHPYIDLSVPENTPVKAALDGTIFNVSWNDEVGHVICIQHPNNVITIYKHCTKPLKKAGDKVSAGTAIAFAGGQFHFELWYEGTAVDASLYMNL